MCHLRASGSTAVATDAPVVAVESPAAPPAAPPAVEPAVEGPDFEAASSFSGARRGYVFKLGPKGLGYYKES